jgi:hypothetical protein
LGTLRREIPPPGPLFTDLIPVPVQNPSVRKRCGCIGLETGDERAGSDPNRTGLVTCLCPMSTVPNAREKRVLFKPGVE